MSLIRKVFPTRKELGPEETQVETESSVIHCGENVTLT